MQPNYQRQTLALTAALVLSGCWEKLTLGEFVDTEPADSNDTEVDVTADNPCNEFQCNTPPGDVCENEETGEMTRYTRNGWCEVVDNAPVCRYPTYTDTCLTGPCSSASGCSDAPLQATDCFTQDAATCADGNKLRVPYPHGVATDAGCAYTSLTVSCENGCDPATNTCIGDPCAGKVCNHPPARFCQDNLLVIWSSQGRCADDGACTYTKRTISCADDCREGRCTENSRCADLVCNTPAANFCLDRDTLFAYSPRGTCDDGACIYTGETHLCTSGCKDGHCQEDLCIGVSCVFPIAPACTPDGDLKIWDGGWDDNPDFPTCIDGVCQYEIYNGEPVCIANDCRDGRCRNDICAGISTYCVDANMPADYCNTQDRKAVLFSEPGTCNVYGFCDYTQLQTEDYNGTFDWAQCVDDPDAGTAP